MIQRQNSQTHFNRCLYIFMQMPWKRIISSIDIIAEMYGKTFSFKKNLAPPVYYWTFVRIRKKYLLMISIKNLLKQIKNVKLRWEFNANYAIKQRKCSAAMLQGMQLSNILAKFTVYIPVNGTAWEGMKKTS